MTEEGPAGLGDVDVDRFCRGAFIGKDVRNMRWVVYLEDSA